MTSLTANIINRKDNCQDPLPLYPKSAKRTAPNRLLSAE